MLARLTGFVLCASLLAACQTVNPNLNKERPITEAESVLALSLPDDLNINFRRSAVQRQWANQEIWRWRSGQAYYYSLFPGRYYRTDYSSRKGLLDTAKRIKFLEEQGIDFQYADMKTGSNGFGQYIYAMKESETKPIRCLAFSQNAGDGSGRGGRLGAGGSAMAFIFGFDCLSTENVDEKEHLHTSLAVLNSLRPKD